MSVGLAIFFLFFFVREALRGEEILDLHAAAIIQIISSSALKLVFCVRWNVCSHSVLQKFALEGHCVDHVWRHSLQQSTNILKQAVLYCNRQYYDSVCVLQHVAAARHTYSDRINLRGTGKCANTHHTHTHTHTHTCRHKHTHTHVDRRMHRIPTSDISPAGREAWKLAVSHIHESIHSSWGHVHSKKYDADTV